MVNIEINLPNFDREFTQRINSEIKAIIRFSIKRVTRNIRERIQKTTRKLLIESPEYKSFFGGKLQAELGIPDPTVIDTVIDKWVEGISVYFLPTKGKFGSLNIGIIEQDYNDVLLLPEASYSYVGGRSSGVIDWLRFLLIEGSNVIVRDYDFEHSIKRGSRTGLGVMVNRKGRIWRVPPEFAGVPEDNFVLRALQEIDQAIDNIVRQEITKGLK